MSLVIGGAGGAFSGNQAQEAVVKRCLSGRGCEGY